MSSILRSYKVPLRFFSILTYFQAHHLIWFSGGKIYSYDSDVFQDFRNFWWYNNKNNLNWKSMMGAHKQAAFLAILSFVYIQPFLVFFSRSRFGINTLIRSGLCCPNRISFSLRLNQLYIVVSAGAEGIVDFVIIFFCSINSLSVDFLNWGEIYMLWN